MSSKFIKKYSLTFYFVLTYLIMIVTVILRLFWGLDFIIYWFFSAWNPTIAALITSWLIGGWTEVKILLKGFLKWKVGYKWYLPHFF